jgi:small subunit ribosomal protein S9
MATAETVEKSKVADILGTGRRKSSVARVRIRPGSGNITINKRPLEDFFPLLQDRQHVFAPLEATGTLAELDVLIRVNGGGPTG